MSFVGLTPQEEQRMLKAIGVSSFEDLLAAVPRDALLDRPLAIAGPLSEIELRRKFLGMARENDADRAVSFLGGGIYDHYIPSAVPVLASRSEFATAYTPYQPEVAQGTLAVIFQFQSMIAELTGCDVANASLYDGATAAVEAALLARTTTRRNRVVVAGAIHPHSRQVLETYLGKESLALVPHANGVCAADAVTAALGPDVACVVYQHPNFLGLLEQPKSLHRTAHQAGALAIAIVDPVALALLEPPGSGDEDGADMVVGEGQGLGNPPSFGGPLLGFFACRQELVRRMPGRIVGETVDKNGLRGFVLTLQTREQHIRREKATSNICTNQGLVALRATIHMALLGRVGMREVAELCVQKAHHAARLAAALPGFSLPYRGAFFKEFVVECPIDAAAVIRSARRDGILPGVDLGSFDPAWKRHLLVAVTEQRSAEEIERWASSLARAAKESS